MGLILLIIVVLLLVGAFPTWGPPIQACHRQIDSRFINELQPSSVESGDHFLISASRLPDSFGVALGSVERLFFRGRLSAWSNRLIVETETPTRCLAFTRRQSSSSVRSLPSLTHCRTNSRAFSFSSGLLPPPCGKASGEPMSRLRLRKFFTVAKLTWNNSATSSWEYWPLSQASTILCRKSLE